MHSVPIPVYTERLEEDEGIKNYLKFLRIRDALNRSAVLVSIFGMSLSVTFTITTIALYRLYPGFRDSDLFKVFLSICCAGPIASATLIAAYNIYTKTKDPRSQEERDLYKSESTSETLFRMKKTLGWANQWCENVYSSAEKIVRYSRSSDGEREIAIETGRKISYIPFEFFLEQSIPRRSYAPGSFGETIKELNLSRFENGPLKDSETFKECQNLKQMLTRFLIDGCYYFTEERSFAYSCVEQRIVPGTSVELTEDYGGKLILSKVQRIIPYIILNVLTTLRSDGRALDDAKISQSNQGSRSI